MLGYVIVGMLAAFGALCAGWLVYGMLLPRSGGRLLVMGENAPELLRRCVWLREMGLLEDCLAVLDTDLGAGERAWQESRNIEIWSAVELVARLEMGAKEHGAGTGDPPGSHQCGGISEL